ncbi:MAG: hypothetical protein ABI968_09960, partial [Acidobacteriota bacterium]
MQLTLCGGTQAPAVAMLGLWDPFTQSHEALIRQMCSHARSEGLSAVAVLLDPAPAVYVSARPWPTFSDHQTRLSLLQSIGLDAVACVTFSREDLESGAEDFFDLVCAHIDLKEFWIKPAQALGSGSRGGPWAVLAQTRKRGITLRRLPPEPDGDAGAAGRSHLVKGEFRRARCCVGRPPTLHRPPGDDVSLPWPSGWYQAVPVEFPDGSAVSSSFGIELPPNPGGTATLRWPSPAVEWLS